MADFVSILFGHLRSSQKTQFEETASAGPALVNAEMLVAQGCPKHYAEVLTALYTANHLPCPDLSLLFDQRYVTETCESGYYSAVPEETKDFDDDVESFLRDVEDVEELPTSSTKYWIFSLT